MAFSSQLNVVGWNFRGKFKGSEIKDYGEHIIKQILVDNKISVFFGQQINFKPKLPEDYQQLGNSRAFIVYDKTSFRASDEKRLKHRLKDLQQMGRFPLHYLPETNYVVCKFKMINKPDLEFLALSWLTEEVTHGEKVRSTNTFKKLTKFALNLSILEELPILICGSFLIDPKEAMSCLPYGLLCHSYRCSPRRALRANNLFISSSEACLIDPKPLVCPKTRLVTNIIFNPEDAFYFDPVIAGLVFAKRRQSRVEPNSPAGIVQSTWSSYLLQRNYQEAEFNGIDQPRMVRSHTAGVETLLSRSNEDDFFTNTDNPFKLNPVPSKSEESASASDERNHQPEAKIPANSFEPVKIEDTITHDPVILPQFSSDNTLSRFDEPMTETDEDMVSESHLETVMELPETLYAADDPYDQYDVNVADLIYHSSDSEPEYDQNNTKYGKYGSRKKGQLAMKSMSYPDLYDEEVIQNSPTCYMS